MDDLQAMRERFRTLTTPYLADACLRARVPVRCGPPGLRAVEQGMRLCGRVVPARHAGSVDVFLEAIGAAMPGGILVVDNGGRQDEACVGDLVVLEAEGAGLDGLVIWGLHRDTVDVRSIGLPLFSLGTLPTGPQRLDPRPDDALTAAQVGGWTVTGHDLVVGDEDGVLFVPSAYAEDLFALAESIRDTERRQAALIREGVSLRRQLRFDAFLAAREQRPGLTFREYLRSVGGAIEE